MSNYALPIFPEDTLATSVTTTVWIGVWIVVFFNLRLGWSLSGLVVPGYLAPLLIAKPISAAVIVVEALLTYCIVWFLSERLNRFPHWCSFFGRDRFFSLVVVSVLVRALMDGWFFPWAGPRLNELLDLSLDYRNHLHSYGLIIVALLANYFWKPGLRRGCIPLVVTVGATFFVVRFVLISFTNYSVGSLHYMYEDIASSLLASPKAYIILITTAFIASWMNLYYGWEFNGILIPALLALQWYCPWKILASFGEAAVILLVASLVLRQSFWNRTTIQGGRKILFFFTIAFLYRMMMGWLMPRLLPSVPVTDFYGFGYLLSTLLAMKAYDHGLAIRITRASLQVSLVGAVAGTLLGFLLTWLPDGWLLPQVVGAAERWSYNQQPDADLVSLIRSDKVMFYQKRLPNSFVRPFAQDGQQFAEGVRLALQYADQRDEQLLAQARSRLAAVGYGLFVVENRYLYLREESPPRGWGLYAIDLEQSAALSIEVPVPLDEPACVEAGLALFRHLGARSLAIAGASPSTNRDGSADALRNPHTLFATFHRLVARGNSMQVRGYGRHTLAALHGVTSRDADVAAERTASSLWIKRSVPSGLQIKLLRKMLHGFTVHWQATPWRNLLRDDSAGGFCELILNAADRRRLVANLARLTRPSESRDFEQVDGHLNRRLLDTKVHIARRGTNAYVPAKQEELLYLDEEVLKPLIRLARQLRDSREISSSRREQLTAIASTAAVFNYRLVLLRDVGRPSSFLILVENEPWQRHWGTYVFRCGLREPYVVQVPRPLYERNAFEFGLAQFERPPGSALLIAGAHPRTNHDGSADVARLANKVSLFNLVHQVLLREVGSRPMLVAQARAIQAPVDADVILAADDGAGRDDHVSPLLQRLTRLLESDGLRTRFVDGQPEVAGYEVGMTLQALSVSQAENKQLVGLWLSPSLRTKFRQHRQDTQQAKQFSAVGIPTIERELFDHLCGLHVSMRTQEIPRSVRTTVMAYLRTQDISRLRQLQHDWPDLIRLIDHGSGQTFLLITTEPGVMPCIVNLSGALDDSPKTVRAFHLSREQVVHYVDSRATWLEVRAAR